VRVRRGTEGVAEPPDDISHGAPTLNIAGCEGTDLGGAAFIVVPELDAAAIEKGDEEAIDGRGPVESAAG
jgi:hypothetical protein